MAFVQFVKGQNWGDNYSVIAPDNSWSVVKKVLKGGLSEGLEVLEVNAGDFQFTILVGKGMGLGNGKYRDLKLGWDSPVNGPVHPKYVELERRNGLGWLDGFDEWFCRCGLVSNGPPGTSIDGNRYTLHGRISNLPASALSILTPENSKGIIEIKGVVEEASLFSPKLVLETTYSIEIGSNRLKITDKVKNLGSSNASFQLLYHCNIGQPFLSVKSYWKAPLIALAPQTQNAAAAINSYSSFGPSQSGFKEQVFLCKPLAHSSGKSLATIVNPNINAAFVIRFDVKALPCFTVWKNLGATEEGYVVGLEPATNYPNFTDFEKAQDRCVLLGPNKEWIGELELEVWDKLEEVQKIEHEITALQINMPQIHSNPLLPFTP